MVKKLKQWFWSIMLRLMSNRKIRTWVLCFALRHVSAQKIVGELGIEDESI
jgi:hypothetical protein